MALALQSAAIGLALRTAIAQVQDAVERVEGKVDRIAAMLEAERLGRAVGDRNTLQPLADRVGATGNLSVTDWSSIAPLGPQITRDTEALRTHVRRQLGEVDSRFTPGARADTVDELLGDRLLTETLALLLVVEDNYRLWQEIRLANVRLREPEHLADHLADAQAAISAGIRDDQAIVDAIRHVAGELLPPKPGDGLAPLGSRQLANAAVRLHDLMEWFADQRLLDLEPAEQYGRPGWKDSAGHIASQAVGFVKAVPAKVLPGRKGTAIFLPEPDPDVLLDRIRGALLGVHAGDSLGATLEFTSADEARRRFPDGLRDIIGGGTFGWARGAATDDTDLTLAVARAYGDNTVAHGDHDTVAHGDHDTLVRTAADHMLAWYHGRPKDIGNATREALAAYDTTRDPTSSGLTDEHSQGNGSLMRTIPVALARPDADRRAADAAAISAITHAHPVCRSACVAYCDLADLLLAGADPTTAVALVREGLTARATESDFAVDAAIGFGVGLLDGTDWPSATGWVLDSLTLAVWAILADHTLEDALVRIVMHGGDTDTNGAIAGGLLGARHGLAAIPDRWLDVLQHRDTLMALGETLAAIRTDA